MGFPYGFKSSPELDSPLVFKKTRTISTRIQQGDSTWPAAQTAKSVLTPFVPVRSRPASTAAPNAKRWKKLQTSIAPARTQAAKAIPNKPQKKRPPSHLPRTAAETFSSTLALPTSGICENASRNHRSGKAAFPKIGTRNRRTRCGASDELPRTRRTGRSVWPLPRPAC
jgi:hypothetical protein